MAEGLLKITFDKGAAWLDTGTIESLMEASQYVQAIQSRQGILVGAPEIATLNRGAITQEQFKALAARADNSAMERPFNLSQNNDLFGYPFTGLLGYYSPAYSR